MPLMFKDQGFVEGYVPIAAPDNSPLEKIIFGRVQLTQGRAPYTARTEGNEVVLDILSGVCDLAVTFAADTRSYPNLGGRADVFGGRPTLICLPPKTEYRLMARSPRLDVAVSAAPCPDGGQPAVITPDDNVTNVVGAGNWERRVHLGTVGTGLARRLMVGETINKPGCWSSYPPHKHDEERPGEVPMEEVYFYVVKPKQGFGVQCLYQRPGAPDRLDEAFIVRDGDTVVLPRGYHPAVAAPGYQVCYVWVLYAEADVYGAAWSDDPDHAWVRNVEAMLR